jgi:predicted SAM-dependent methyltransferase
LIGNLQIRSLWRNVYPRIKRFRIVQRVLAARNACSHQLSDPQTVAVYLSTHDRAKLHLGCGPHQLSGWLNADITVFRPDNVVVDATRQFPLPSSSFDFVFTEHMVEHLPLDGALNTFRESYRVLRPAGVIRVSTPDLKFLLSLTVEPLDEIRTKYITWSCQEYLQTPVVNSAVVINNFVRNWGHKFIFDRETLAWALQAAGFRDVRFCTAGQSERAELDGLENTLRLPHDFVALESICAEAVK